jgi:hypothetical protein
MPGMCAAMDQHPVRRFCFEMQALVSDWALIPVYGKGCWVYDGEL